MKKDLSDIFDSITPDNIKNIPVVQNAMEIFIETIEELAQESIDVKNIYNNDLIKQELMKIYLNDLYEVLQSIQLNTKIVEKIDKINSLYSEDNPYFDKSVIYNLTEYINEEHFLTLKAFNQTKGTTRAIEYIYSLISVFVSPNDDPNSLVITEGEPFEYSAQGSLPKEFFDYVINPLAHPLGFVYSYRQFLEATFIDYYSGDTISYDTTTLEVRTLHPDGTTDIYDYLYYYNSAGKKIKRIVTNITTVVDTGSRTKNIFFSDDSYLKQVTYSDGQTYVWYMNADDTINVTFEDQSSVYAVYSYSYELTVTDDFSNSDCKETMDYFARKEFEKSTLTIGSNSQFAKIGYFAIGTPVYTLQPDKGFNIYRDRNNNYLPTDMQSKENGRLEHYFTPTAEADLKLLNGKVEKDVDIYENGKFVETQKVKYTDIIDPNYQIVPWVNTEANFVKQNKGNEKYLAQEHYIENCTKYFENEIHVELDTTVPWLQVAGFGSMIVGECWLKYKLTTIEDDAESYFEFGIFDQNSDDDFTCGVYRNGILVEDNNISKIK